MADNIRSTGSAFYSTSDACWPEKQNLRQETIPLGSQSEVFFEVNTEAEVWGTHTTTKGGFKNRLFEMCQYVVPVVRSSEKGRPLLRPCCQKARLFHYTAQNNSRQPLRWNDALFFETICGKFRIMKIYFYRWHSLPCLELPPWPHLPFAMIAALGWVWKLKVTV